MWKFENNSFEPYQLHAHEMKQLTAHDKKVYYCDTLLILSVNCPFQDLGMNNTEAHAYEIYEFMIDHRSYTHNLSSCVIKARKKN